MGVTLDYRTAGPVSVWVRDPIEAEARQLARAHDWWAEPLSFFDPGEGDGRLYGGNKIFLLSYSPAGGGFVEVDAADDSLMAYRDSCFILGKLAEWSKAFGLTWEVDCAGEPVGTIAEGRWDKQLAEYVEGMKTSFPWPVDFEEKAKAISARYASRR